MKQRMPSLPAGSSAPPQNRFGRTKRTGAAKQGNPPHGPLLVGSSNDPLEKEADEAADRALSDRTPGPIGAAAPVIRRSSAPALAENVAAPPRVGMALASSGHSLDPVLRSDMEARFGWDFSRVRVHVGGIAEQSANEIHARAYTVGNHIVFGIGGSPSGSPGGRRLIAHELAHVIQQSGGSAQDGFVQRQVFMPPPQMGGFKRGFDKDVEYLRHYDPAEEARRKAAIAREKAIAEALKPFKDALLGEFEEDPSTAGILMDTGLGLIPFVDQGLDVRDIIAHIFMMSTKGQHRSPARWLGLALTLIGVVPEIGSAVKGAAKLLIKKGPKAIGPLVGFLSRALQVTAELPALAARFRQLVVRHWASWVGTGKAAFATALSRVEKFLETFGDTGLLKQVRAIREMAGKMLDDAFERLRREIDDALESLSPHAVPAGGPHRIPDTPSRPQPMQTSGSGSPGKAAKNEYPDFETPKGADAKIVKQQAAALSKHLGLNIPADRVLEAPWVGRVYGSEGKKLSSGTSQGWLRNESKFWTLFKSKFPDDYKLLDEGEKVSAGFAKKYGWAKTYVGQKLVHHHMDNGPFVVAIPESLHKRLSGAIHAKPKVVK